MSVSLRKDIERLNALLTTARDALKDAVGKLDKLRAQIKRMGGEPEA